MTVVTRQVGTTTVYALEDGAGTFFTPRAEAFAAATADQWRRADEFDPGAVTAQGEWFLRFRAFAIRLEDGRVILVDAGIGPEGAPASAWAPCPGHLPESLAEAGIDANEIETVVLTHLHTDHIGWSVSGLFPNAVIVLQRKELDWVSPRLRALLPEDRLVQLLGDSRLAPGISIVATPGHTPGHQSVLVHDTLAITGDLLVHAVQLVAPELEYAHEVDPVQAKESRLTLLSKVDTLATPHLTEPFVRTI